MKSLKSSTTAALLSLSIGISGLIISSTTSTRGIPQSTSYTQFINMQNKNSCNRQNQNTTMNISKSDIITQQNLIEIKKCLDEEPAEFGEDISYLDFFCSIRKQDNYEHIISLMCSSSPKKYLLSVMVLLSKINYNDLKNIEKYLVVDMLHENSLKFQEYALTTISIWNNPELLTSMIDVQIDNMFLQGRLNKIVNRFKALV